MDMYEEMMRELQESPDGSSEKPEYVVPVLLDGIRLALERIATSLEAIEKSGIWLPDR